MLYSINLIVSIICLLVKRIKQFYTIKINYFRTKLSYLYKFCYEIYRILLHFVQDKSGQVWNTFVCTCEYTHIKARIQWYPKMYLRAVEQRQVHFSIVFKIVIWRITNTKDICLKAKYTIRYCNYYLLNVIQA